MKRVIAFFAFCSVSMVDAPAAQAGFYSGNDVYDQCLAKEFEDTYYQQSAQCMSYIAGAYDALLFAKEATGKADCSPDELTLGQMRDVAVKYMRDHPESRNLNAAILVALSMAEAWPCGSD